MAADSESKEFQLFPWPGEHQRPYDSIPSVLHASYFLARLAFLHRAPSRQCVYRLPRTMPTHDHGNHRAYPHIHGAQLR